jgi:hypothetical protein
MLSSLFSVTFGEKKYCVFIKKIRDQFESKSQIFSNFWRNYLKSITSTPVVWRFGKIRRSKVDRKIAAVTSRPKSADRDLSFHFPPFRGGQLERNQLKRNKGSFYIMSGSRIDDDDDDSRERTVSCTGYKRCPCHVQGFFAHGSTSRY